MPKNIPFWSQNAQKRMIELGLSKKELAAELHVNYSQLCNVLSGYINNTTIMADVCKYLKI